MAKGKSQTHASAKEKKTRSSKAKIRASKIANQIANFKGNVMHTTSLPVTAATTTSTPKSNLNRYSLRGIGEEEEDIATNLDENFHQMRQSYMVNKNTGSNWEKSSGPGQTPGQSSLGSRGGGRLIIKNLWDVCCNETEAEINELDAILKKFGLPSVHYSKTKMYDITEYEGAPDLATCKVKDFLDFYVFPYLLPAIQALIQFARVNRVFQCRFCTFNALDYIVEYLYNNNPRYPERLKNPIPLFDIPFCKQWLEKYPRKPPPKWMLMSSEEAAIVIQRAVRGWMVRCRPDVQEMRQFWRDIRKDMEEERMLLEFGRTIVDSPPIPLYSPYYEEFYGETEEVAAQPAPYYIPFHHDESPSPNVSHHSDNCIYCKAFRKFIESQPEDVLKSYQRQASSEAVAFSPGGSPGSNPPKTSSGANLSAGKTPVDTAEANETGGEETDTTLTPAVTPVKEGKRKESSGPAPSVQGQANTDALPSFSNSKSIKPTKQEKEKLLQKSASPVAKSMKKARKHET